MKTATTRRAFSLALIILLTATATLPAQSPMPAAQEPEQADHHDHYVLRGVLIGIKDGRSYAGYVRWPSWEFAEKSEARFPQILLNGGIYDGNLPDQLELLTEVQQASAQVTENLGVEKLLVTDVAGWLKLPTAQISGIAAHQMPHDGHNIDFIFSDFSPSSVTLLAQATPRAIYTGENTGWLLISYHNQIGQRELAQLDRQFAKLLIEQAARSEQDFADAKTKRQLEQYCVVAIELPSGC